jgi:hypothetical protein
MKTVWNQPVNRNFPKAKEIVKALYEYCIPSEIVQSDMPRHVGIAVPFEKSFRALSIIEKRFGRRF